MLELLNDSKKLSHRGFFVIRMVLDSFLIWKLKDWIDFWIKDKDKEIELESLNFYIRRKNILTKFLNLEIYE